MTKETMLELKNIWKEYTIDDDTIFTALKDISLTISKGEFSSIMGPSGSGKSTLMHLIGLLDKPSRGKIFIDKKDVSTLNDDETSTLRSEFVGFVFQQFNLINKLTVTENIMLPTVYARNELDFKPKERALELIEKFGLAGKENSYPNKISGGQQQRVAMARALMMNPKLVLADEPTGNLDSKTGKGIMDLLVKLNKNEGRTIIIVTHEAEIAEYTKRIIKIHDGEVDN